MIFSNKYGEFKTLDKMTTISDKYTIMSKVNCSYWSEWILGRCQGIDEDDNYVNECPDQSSNGDMWEFVLLKDGTHHIGKFNSWDHRDNV